MRGFVVAVACMAFASIAFAQTTKQSNEQLDAARALANAGYQLFTKGEYAEAYERFRSAETIFHAPPHLLFMARCKAALNQLVEASEFYEQLAAETVTGKPPREFRDAQKAGAEEQAKLAPRIPHLMVHARGAADMTLMVDGASKTLDKPIALDPGDHHVVVSAPGYRDATADVSLAEGAAEKVELSLSRLPAAPEKEEEDAPVKKPHHAPSYTGPIVLMTIGGAGLIAGAITGGLALQRANELHRVCPERVNCPGPNEDIEDSARTLGTASTVAFAVGGAVAGAGLIWLIVVVTSDDDEAAFTPWGVRF